jgi:ribosomal protein S18 acetylase RimI-like enzyme
VFNVRFKTTDSIRKSIVHDGFTNSKRRLFKRNPDANKPMKFTIQRKGQNVAELTLRKVWGSDYEIQYIKVDSELRKQGLASTLLERAKVFASKNRVNLVGLIDPDRTGLTHEQIESWLKRHGFKPTSYDFNGDGKTKRAYIFESSIQKSA